VEGRLEDSALIVRVGAVGPIGRRPAQLDGNQRGMGTAEDVQGNFGCGCGRREVVSIVRPARTFRVVGVVGDYDGALDPLGCLGPRAAWRGLEWTEGMHVGRGGRKDVLPK